MSTEKVQKFNRKRAWSLRNSLEMLILVGRLNNCSSSSSSRWGEQNQVLLLLLCKRETFCNRGESLRLVPHLLALAEPTNSTKADHTVPDELPPSQTIYFYGVIWDPCGSLVDKHPGLKVISTWRWILRDKMKSTSKTEEHKSPCPLRIAFMLNSVWQALSTFNDIIFYVRLRSLSKPPNCWASVTKLI